MNRLSELFDDVSIMLDKIITTRIIDTYNDLKRKGGVYTLLSHLLHFGLYSIVFFCLPVITILAIFNLLKNKNTTEKLQEQSKKNPSDLVFSPPAKVEMTLCFVVPVKDRNAVVGDFAEGYNEMVHQYSKKVANRWYFWQTARFIWVTFGKGALKVLATIGAVAGAKKAVDWVLERFESS